MYTHSSLAFCSFQNCYKLDVVTCNITDVMCCVRHWGTWAELTLPSVSLPHFLSRLCEGSEVEWRARYFLLPVYLWPLTTVLFDDIGILKFIFNQSWSWVQSCFRLLWSYFWLLLSFLIVFFDPKDIQPHFCSIKNIFSSCGKISLPHFLSSHPSAIASQVLLFAWPSAISKQRLLIKWSIMLHRIC